MTGLLLVNLGTPQSPTTGDVRTYLREFLSDPYVIDINPIGRWMLLNLIILPTRPKQSAEAYQKIWTDRGSPLLFHSQDLARNVQEALGGEWKVALAMRYGAPSIRDGLAELKQAGVDRVIAMPLYPHFALSSTVTSEEAITQAAAALWDDPVVTFTGAFYDDDGFIDAFAQVGRQVLADANADHVLFSYHGLPERHIHKTDPTGSHCLASPSCCDAMVEANANCYRAQCYATTRALASALDLPTDKYTVTFQSRLGRTKWIEPYTDVLLDELAARGIKRLAVFCPAFVADCLETLEEIGIRAVEQFQAAGGEHVTLVPSLNSTPRWVQAVADMARKAAA